jgi:hypothetical protein
MTHLPDRNDLISECADFLRLQVDIFDGKIDQRALNGFRFKAAQTWLKENPKMVLHVASISSTAAQTMLAATGIYLVDGGDLTKENQSVIGQLLIGSERFLSKKGGEDRSNRTLLYISIVLCIEGLKRKHQIRPTRDIEGENQSSGCDIVAEAVKRCEFGTPNTYVAVKRIWDKRKNLLGQIPQTQDMGDDLFGALTRGLGSYIETVATADLSVNAGSVRSKSPKS